MPLREVVLWRRRSRARGGTSYCVGKNYHEHAHEFAASGFDSSAARGRGAEAPDHLLQGARLRHRASRAGLDRPQGLEAIDYEAELGRHHRQGRTRHQGGERVGSRLGLHDHQRRDGARPAGSLQPMADRQVAGHVLSDGSLGRHPRRDRSQGHQDPMLDQRRASAETPIRATSFSTCRRSSRRSRQASG